MKIGIFTFHCAQNYGAVLQAYGLQEYLLSQGHDAYIIDYRPDYLVRMYQIASYKHIRSLSLKTIIRELLVLPIRLRRAKAFNSFINKRLRLCKLDLYNENNDFDAFVYGSDQIWNPRITEGFDDVYFGKIPATKGKLLFAYAASMGSTSQLTETDKEYLKEALSHFSGISVRENELKEMLVNEIGVKASCVCDPVLLVGKELFASIVVDKSVKSKRGTKSYLLLFQLEVINDFIRPITKGVADKFGFKLMEIISRREVIDFKVKQSCTPEELLKHIKKASYIITTSFHGTVLSILFGKQFNTIRIDPVTDSRAVELLAKLNIEECMVDLNNIVSSRIDYDCLQLELEKYVSESRNILNTYINDINYNSSI